MKFKVGDIVEWTSQSAGIVKPKRGEIVGRIPAGESARRTWETLGVRSFKPVGTLATKHLGNSRDHESYFVSVEQKTLGNEVTPRRLVYWPRVSLLKVVS